MNIKKQKRLQEPLHLVVITFIFVFIITSAYVFIDYYFFQRECIYIKAVITKAVQSEGLEHINFSKLQLRDGDIEKDLLGRKKLEIIQSLYYLPRNNKSKIEIVIVAKLYLLKKTNKGALYYKGIKIQNFNTMPFILNGHLTSATIVDFSKKPLKI